MKFSRLIKALDLPEGHLLDDIKDYNTLLNLLDSEQGTIQKMKKEDEDALSHTEEQVESNKKETLPTSSHLPSTLGDNYNTEI